MGKRAWKMGGLVLAFATAIACGGTGADGPDAPDENASEAKGPSNQREPTAAA
jgi:hypothetical protein